jgi:hypothetical protein
MRTIALIWLLLIFNCANSEVVKICFVPLDITPPVSIKADRLLLNSNLKCESSESPTAIADIKSALRKMKLCKSKNCANKWADYRVYVSLKWDERDINIYITRNGYFMLDGKFYKPNPKLLKSIEHLIPPLNF